jgi:hypothetical protein
MATEVDIEVVVNSANQNVDGEGLHPIDSSVCPDLYAATIRASNDESKLPIGWKVQYLRDSNTGEEKGILLRAPDGRTWDQDKCSRAAALQSKGWWSWFPLLAGGVIFYYLITKKK